jgi:hypothetical protein
VDDLIKKFCLENVPRRSTPLDTNERFEENIEDKLEGVPYRSLVGTLLYLSTCSRPDIAFSVNQAAKFCDKATLRHWNQLKKIAAYVKSTKDYGLYFDTDIEDEKVVNLDIYTDADWANCVDSRRSISGGIILSWGCPIVCQTIVATSTCLVEIISACTG